MLETVKFIQDHSLNELTSKFGISVRRHNQYPNLAMLKYSQIDSPMGERIVQECRGLILDEADQYRVVSFPYTKFFNHGEGHAAKLHWETAKVYEKLDGSLMTLYHYDNKWHVASSGLPDAAGKVNPLYGGTFADLFWEVWDANGLYIDLLSPNCCYMFELMTEYNRIICKQERRRIVMHGLRYLPTLREVDPHLEASVVGCECVQHFPLSTLEGCLEAAQALNPMDCEGYVVRDGYFNRVKVKSPQYVALAHLKEGMSGRRMLEIVRANESEEFLAHFPEFAELHSRVRDAYKVLCDRIDDLFAQIKEIDNRKDFAIRAAQIPGAAALFAMKDGKAGSARDFFANAAVGALEKCIGIDLTAEVPVNE